MSKPLPSGLRVRRAVPQDAGGIVTVLTAIVAERIHSAIDRAWTVEEERHYLESLSPREAVHVAIHDVHGVVGLQILDLWSPVLKSMAHVGQVGTFLLPEWRGRGVGGQLWAATLALATESGYRKFMVQVIDDVEDDEVLMELHHTHERSTNG